jgi:hypothetical protein
LPELERNSERPIKRARKDVNTSAEAKEACDITVNQMKHRFEEAHHTKCFSLIEPELFAAHKVAFPRELVINALKYYPMLSKDKLESELSVLYRHDTFANVKTVLALWTLMRENNLEAAVRNTQTDRRL